MKKSDIVIRSIQVSDLHGAMRLSTEQGWNQTEKDWMRILGPSQNICLLAESNGKIIGTTAAMNYSDNVAWINMVLVDKEYRRQGISKSLFKNILEQLKDCKSIKLDATTEGKQVYQQFDFKEEYRITRMTADVIHYPPNGDNQPAPEPIQSKDIKQVIAYDEYAFGTNRTTLIKSIVSEFPHKAWMLKRKNVVVAFALGRDGRKYNHIGPVMASTFTEASKLITTLLKTTTKKPIAVDVLDDKEEMRNWLSAIGFVQQRQFIRMYQHENPFPGNIDHQYLICGPEFG